MRNVLIPLALFAACLLPLAGCSSKGYKLAPVSGTVTSNGEPVPKLSVVFSPEPIGENNSVGPYSAGVTDAAGKFTLTTRYDDDGAVVGQHRVAFEYTDIGETEMFDLRDELAEAQDEGNKEDFEIAKKKIRGVKSKA